MIKRITLFIFASIQMTAFAQVGYWQQKVQYKIDIDFDVKKHQFDGKQEIIYINNSPDTLNKIYFHLYFNAFQPGSMMDLRSRSIEDPDQRISDRIANLKPEEIGYHKMRKVMQKDQEISYSIDGTIMEVKLYKPLYPNTATRITLDYFSQVPVQIRRSGRNNDEGIAYSMSQWYPKVVEYDVDGWSTNPYIGREFHGVWGDFDVKIHIDKEYTLGATGYLQNAQTIGKGYEDNGTMMLLQKTPKLTWHFKAPNVHDFVWAADTAYVHKTEKVPDGPTLHFLYKNDTTIAENWTKLRPYAVRTFELMKELYGGYPYEQYSIIQAGDGGMEYPMATLISGTGKLGGLISVTVHESIHSWFQGALATNEAKYAWMDEGFTSYAQQIVLDSLFHRKKENPFVNTYWSYFALVNSGKQEPMCTHADHFTTNRAYGVASYTMGSIFLYQLGYIIGEEKLDVGMKKYYAQWKFKHPTPTDLKRVMEKVSGMELDWYFEYWIHSTKTIDYGVGDVSTEGKGTIIKIEKIGLMPMPLDIQVKLKNGEERNYYIPLSIMRGAKKLDDSNYYQLENWPWTYPEYGFKIDVSIDEIESIQIDPLEKMADVDRNNNFYSKSGKTFWGKILKK